MSKAIIEEQGAVAVLRFNNGVTNAISTELLDDLTEAVRRIKSEFKGMVLAGGEKFFCIGLDLPALLQLERPDMTDFYIRFNRAVLDLYTLPMPTVCSIAGHATAGGAIFALSTDFRFVSSGRKFIGLNEVKIGLPVPYLGDLLLRQIVGDRCATEMLFGGEFMEPEQAYSAGLVDAICSPEELEAKAVAKISELAALPPGGIAAIKINRVDSVRSRYEEMRHSDIDLFQNCWFNPEVQEVLKESAKKF